MNKNELNNFDQLLKGKLDELQPVYDPKSWEALEKQLPKKSTPLFKNPWIIGGVAAASAAILTFALMPGDSTETTYQPKQITPLQTEISATDIDTKEAIEIITSPEMESTMTQSKTVIENTPANNATKNTDNDLISETDVNPSTAIENEVPLTDDSIVEKHTSETTTPAKDPIAEVTPVDLPEELAIVKPNSEYTVDQAEGCLGTTFTFSALSQSKVDYLWSFGDGTFSKEDNPTHTYKKEGSFKVNLIVKSKIDNTVLSQSKDQLITVLPAPAISFTNELLSNDGIPETSFINTTDKATTWSWNFGDGYISSEKDPYHSYRLKGMYAVSLTATNEEGCTATLSQQVAVTDDYNLLAPNSFTPNGDGLNDEFMPVALEILDAPFSLSIFSTTDGLVFESTSTDNKWDGINKQTGSPAQSGNYIWVVKLINSDGNTEQYKGALLLLK
jgi:gliding motility-associated-like protein